MCCLCRYSLYLGFEDFRAVFLPDVLHGHFPAAGSCIGFASPVPHLFFARPAEPCGLESVLIFVCIAAVRWLRHCWPTALCAIRLTQTHEPQSSITMPVRQRSWSLQQRAKPATREKAMIFWITSMYSPAVSFILRFLPVVSSAAALLWMSFRRLKAFSYSALIVFIVSGLPPLSGWLIRAKRRYSFFSSSIVLQFWKYFILVSPFNCRRGAPPSCICPLFDFLNLLYT